MNVLGDFQRGFQKHKSTVDNCIDLMQMIRVAKRREAGYRSSRVPNYDRTKTFSLFIDFKKAFDMVDRRLLLLKMIKFGYSKELV